MYCGRNDRRRSAAEACDRIMLSVLERIDLGAASAALRDCLPAVYDIISCTCIYGSTKGFTYKIKNYLYRHKWLIFFGLFIVWMFLSFLANKRYSDYQGLSAALYGIPSRNEGILLRTLEFVMAAGLLAVSDGRKKRRVLNLLLAASLLLAVPVLAQSNDGLADILGLSGNEAFRYMAEEGRYASVLNYFNHYGYYLCTMIVLSGSMLMLAETAGGVCFSLFVYVINIITLNINNTFGGWLAAGISLIVLLFIMTGRFHGCKSRPIYPYFKLFTAVILFFLISGAMEKNGERYVQPDQGVLL